MDKILFTFASSFIAIICSINIINVTGRTTELDKNDIDLESLEQHLEEEQGQDYWPIPLKNMRQIRLSTLQNLTPLVRQQAIEYYTTVLNQEPPEITSPWFKLFVPSDKDLQKKKEMKLDLLKRGIWAECGWVKKLPSPFGKDDHDQCTEPELQYLLDNSE